MTRKPTPITTATRRELRLAGKLTSALGKAALGIAARLDGGGSEKVTCPSCECRFETGRDAGSAYAAMAKELRMMLDSLRTGGAAATDTVDEIKARRNARKARQQGA